MRWHLVHSSNLAEAGANYHSVMILFGTRAVANRLKDMFKFLRCLAIQYFIHTNSHIHFNQVSDTEPGIFNKNP